MKLLTNQADKRYIFFTGDPGEMRALEQHLNKVPQYMLLPTFRGVPRPEVFLDKFKRGDQYVYYCAAGPWREVVTFCQAKK